MSSVTYYGEGGAPGWYKNYDAWGTMTRYVTYDAQGNAHVVYDDGSGGSGYDENPVMPVT